MAESILRRSRPLSVHRQRKPVPWAHKPLGITLCIVGAKRSKLRPISQTKLLKLEIFLFAPFAWCSMKRFHLLVLAVCIAGASAVTFFSSVMPAQAKQCSVERPSNARSHWSYRIIDGQKCWYEGKPMLSKSLLHWPIARTAQADPGGEPNVLPANYYNLLDAQASIPDDSDGFEARWRTRFLEAMGKH
jgi:hypothetical protein